jgi:hypothetical protein
MKSLRLMALVHVVTNAVLLWLGYYWLGVGESRTSLPAMVYFQAEEKRETRAAWRTAWQNVLPLAAAAIVVAAIYWLLALWADYSSKPAFAMASFLTLKFRTPVRPASIARVFNVALWIVRWAVIPVLLLPAVSAIAARGWAGFRSIGSHARRWVYWIEAPVLLLCALWIPLKLVGWVPSVGGFFAMETLSFILRAAVAYLLFAGSWLVLCFITSGGRPRFTQSRTVVSP